MFAKQKKQKYLKKLGKHAENENLAEKGKHAEKDNYFQLQVGSII